MTALKQHLAPTIENSLKKYRERRIPSMLNKALDATSAVLEETDSFDMTYAPVGKRIVVEENGQYSDPEKSPDDTRVRFILDKLEDTGSIEAALQFLGYTHCKECTSDVCQGRYMAGVRASSVCSSKA